MAKDIQAFPRAGFSGEGGYGRPELGMTLRDYFAAKAMQAAIGTSATPYMFREKAIEPEIARMAYGIADAMMVERAGASK